MILGDSIKEPEIRPNDVAAGDPSLAISVMDSAQDILIQPVLEQHHKVLDLSGYHILNVRGSSMTPKGVFNGDKLVCKEVDGSNIGEGKFAVIAVDEDYYKAKNKTLKYRYKLRYTLIRVSKGCDADGLISELKAKTFLMIYIPEMQKHLKEKFAEAISYYPDRELMLSCTFKKGDLRFSFHPVDLITYVGIYRLHRENTGWFAKQL